jgi:hypothetical protein
MARITSYLKSNFLAYMFVSLFLSLVNSPPIFVYVVKLEG